MPFPRSSGLPWVILALLSGLALLVVVVFDLNRTVSNREKLAEDSARRALQTDLREVRDLLGEPEILTRIPEDQHFEWDSVGGSGAWRIPDGLGWVHAPEQASELPVLVQSLVQRAELATGAAAEALWQRGLQDPALLGSMAQGLSLRAAWHAHRQGRPASVAQYLKGVGDERGMSVQARASQILLLATIGEPLPASTRETLGQLEVPQVKALQQRLLKLGTPVSGALEYAERQSQRRTRLQQVFAEGPPLSSTGPYWRVLADSGLALLFPGQKRGAWLTWSDVQAVLEPVLQGELAALGSPQGSPKETDDDWLREEIIPGLASSQLSKGSGMGGLYGPLAWAILVVGLAAICGGAAWLALRAAQQEAQSARLRGEFLTTVTHELKTPLAGIRLVAELLADDHVQAPEKRLKYLRALSAESTRLSMLIENVLDLRRMEAGERAHDAQPENLDELVRATVELFAPLLERGGNQIRFESMQANLHVVVDRNDLRQALLNLLDNARKYGGQGDILIDLSQVGKSAQLRLRDEGPGIEPNERERIFERFTRGSEHQSGGVPGVGIGLNLARAILRRQGGDLRAVDPPGGKGACFVLSLPVVESPVVQSPPVQSTLTQSKAPGGKEQ